MAEDRENQTNQNTAEATQELPQKDRNGFHPAPPLRSGFSIGRRDCQNL